MKKSKEHFEVYKKKYESSCKWIGRVDSKHEISSPYHFFLTAVNEIPETHEENLTITFPELLDKSLGRLEHSLHVNFMVDLGWLLAQYAVNGITGPSMTILYGVEDESLGRIPPHLRVTATRVHSPYPFGHHHTKLSVFFYEDKSVRFAVYTANLIESDWEDRTQGIWISPKCPFLGDGVPINYGESDTLFKVDILRYLNSYHLPELRNCLLRIQKSDCSSIRVCLVTSIPGEHDRGFGYRKLSQLVRQHSTNEVSSFWSLIFQCSSIGSLGSSPNSWFLGEFSKNLCPVTEAKVSVIYPSVENVRRSIHGLFGGACLPYSEVTHRKQTWLNDYMNQWKSETRFRSKAVPHIKTYSMVSVAEKKVSWFLLTSANLSKAAWGRENKFGRLQVMSHEAGVLFLPRFLIGKEFFSLRGSSSEGDPTNEFPIPYDLPLTPYLSTDGMFLYDRHYPRSRRP